MVKKPSPSHANVPLRDLLLSLSNELFERNCIILWELILKK